MKTPHVFSASAAAVLAMSMAAFAQSAQQQPSSPAAQAGKQPETKVTLVGCVLPEPEYRKRNESGKGGPLGTGLGRGDEFVLVNATRITAGPPASAGDCSAATGGEAYELAGSREQELDKYVGRRVQIAGTVKEAKTETTTEGTRPTGGFDPIKQDLKIFEVDIASVRELSASQSPAGAPPAAQAAPPSPRAQQPAPPASLAQPEPQPSASTASRESLPRTASPLPLVGLVGLLSLAAGLALSRRA